MSRAIVVGMLLATMASVNITGCRKKPQEPERPLVVIINQMGVPDNVSQSFQNAYPRADVQRVEKEVWNDGTVNYRFHFRTLQGNAQAAKFSAGGSQVH